MNRSRIVITLFIVMLFTSIMPAYAMTGGSISTLTIGCASTYVAYGAIGFDRNNTGGGYESYELFITDGSGNMLWYRNLAQPVGNSLVPLAVTMTYDIAPVTNPIRLQLISVAGNGFPAQTLWDFSGTCTDLPTAPPTPTITNTPIPPTATQTATATATATPTNTATNTPVPPTATETATATATAVPPTATETATATFTAVPPTATETATATFTAVPPTATETATATPTDTATNTPIPPTATETATATATATNTPEPTLTMTATAVSTSTPTSVPGPYLPEGFELVHIICTTAVYNTAAGSPVGEGAVYLGQTWFVNPIPVMGVDGQLWTEIFVSSLINPYIPTACVG